MSRAGISLKTWVTSPGKQKNRFRSRKQQCGITNPLSTSQLILGSGTDLMIKDIQAVIAKADDQSGPQVHREPYHGREVPSHGGSQNAAGATGLGADGQSRNA